MKIHRILMEFFHKTVGNPVFAKTRFPTPFRKKLSSLLRTLLNIGSQLQLGFVVFLIALHVCVAYAAASESMTLEMVDGALLVVAEDDVADAVERRAESLKQEMDSAEKVRGILAGEFGSKVGLELFVRPTMANMAGMKIERLTVREAILRGELPPIEGLEMKAAVATLEKCGFSVKEDSLFTSMKKGEAAREAYLTEGRLVALSGARPMDIVEILTGAEE